MPARGKKKGGRSAKAMRRQVAERWDSFRATRGGKVVLWTVGIVAGLWVVGKIGGA